MLCLLSSIAAALLWAVSPAAAAEIPSLSPTSAVAGRAFDRFITVWLENTNYAKAAGDRSSPPTLTVASVRIADTVPG